MNDQPEPRPKPQVIHIVVHDPPKPDPLHADPCRAGIHAPAWLTNGNIACGRCGKPL